MITATGLELRAGARILIESATFRIAKGDRIGLVGRNGAGKTTLTKCLAGEGAPAAGTISRGGEVGYLPLGPNRKEHFAWNDIWGWAIPKSIPAERKALAKKLLNDMMTDEEGQLELWKTGAPPPNMALWEKIAEKDPTMRLIKRATLDVQGKVRGAYYFEKWPAVHKAVSDAVTKAATGPRENIAAASKTSVWRSTSSSVVAGDISAML